MLCEKRYLSISSLAMLSPFFKALMAYISLVLLCCASNTLPKCPRPSTATDRKSFIPICTALEKELNSWYINLSRTINISFVQLFFTHFVKNCGACMKKSVAISCQLSYFGLKTQKMLHVSKSTVRSSLG